MSWAVMHRALAIFTQRHLAMGLTTWASAAVTTAQLRRRAELRRTMAEYAAVSSEDRARAKEEAKYSRRRRFSDEDGGSGSSNPDDGETERVTASTAADRVQELIDQDKLPWWAATREELPAAAQQHQLPATSPQELEENTNSVIDGYAPSLRK